LTSSRIAELRENHARRGSLTFMRDLWPLISAEIEIAYYARLAGWSPSHTEQLGAGWPALTPELRNVILDAHGVGPDERWNWKEMLDPCSAAPRTFLEFGGWLRSHLRRYAEAAEVGNVDHPVKTALDALRDLRNEIRMVIDYGGVTGASYRTEVQGWFTPVCAYLSIGPPARRTRELVALMDAGIVTILGPDFGVTSDIGRRAWLPTSTLTDTPHIEAHTLIEARLTDTDIRRTRDPLVRRLLDSGAGSVYRITNGGGRQTSVGGLAVTPAPARLITSAGVPHPSRYALGVPTEGVHWITAAGARPGVNSVTFSDAEAIADAIVRPDSPRRRPPGDNLCGDDVDRECKTAQRTETKPSEHRT
jgi:hypothetical protein